MKRPAVRCIRSLFCAVVLAGAVLAGLAAPVVAWQETEIPLVGFPDRQSSFAGAQGFADPAIAVEELDAFWRDTFDAQGAAYRSPSTITVLDGYVRTACGSASPETTIAFYCPADEGIYLSPIAIIDLSRRFGDYAPVTVLSHEWGHHIQNLLAVPRGESNAHELQADCLAGAWTQQAGTLGLLDKGDVTEAAKLSAESGDDYWNSQAQAGAHGIDDDRIISFMTGYVDGVVACGLPFAAGGVIAPTMPTPAVPRPASGSSGSGVTTARVLPPAPRVSGIAAPPEGYLPQGLAVPHAACFSVAGEGPISWQEMLSRFSDMPNAAVDLGELDWITAQTRQFGCAAPPPGEAGWIDIAIHRFGTPAFAQGAVPYFSQARIANTAMWNLPAPALGEASAAIAGPTADGDEVTRYAAQGSLLVRVTGVAANGDPSPAVDAVMRQVLAAAAAGEPRPDPAARTALQLLPAGPAVSYGACFSTVARGVHTPAAVLQVTGAAYERLGWQDGAYIDFRCDAPPPGGAAYLGVVLHHFATPGQAGEARAIWEGWGTDPTREAKACGTSGTVLVCVDAIGPDGPPAADAARVLRQITGG